MRHDKSKPLPHPMTLSQALSRPWVQTRELRRDQGIVTCLNEFWLTAHRCAPKEKPPTQPPRTSSAVTAAETGLCREGYELLHGRLMTALASDPRGAECVAAHSWDAEHPSPMPYMSRERFLDVLFELATELVPITTGTSATMADGYIDWLLTLFGRVAVQAPMTETHKGTTVVGLFWKWRPEVKPVPELAPGYVALDGGDDSGDGGGGGSGGGGGGGGRRKSKEGAWTSVGSLDQVAEEVAEEAAERRGEDLHARLAEEAAEEEQEEAALERNEAATVLQARARAAHAQKEVALEREHARARRSVVPPLPLVPPSSPAMTPPVMMQEGAWMGSGWMGSDVKPEAGAAAAEVQAHRTPAAAEVAVKERIAELDRKAATGSLSQVERRERRASQDMLASLTQAEQEASQDTFATLEAVQAAARPNPNPNPNAALETVQAATRGRLARRALPSLKKTFLRERARLKGSNMSALIELALEDQRDQLKRDASGSSRHVLFFGLHDASLLARADSADGNAGGKADGKGLSEGGGAIGGGAAAEAQAVEIRISDLEQREIRISDLEQREAAGELSESEKAELAASEAKLRFLLEMDAAKVEAEAVQSRVQSRVQKAELTHKQAASDLIIAEKAELNSSESKLAALEATAAEGSNGDHARGPPPIAVSHAVGERGRHLGGYGGNQLQGGDAGSYSNGSISPQEGGYDLSPGGRRPGAPFLPWARAHSPTRSTAPQPHQPAATAAQPNGCCIRTAAMSGPAYAPHVPPAYPRPLLQPHATTDGSVSWYDVGPRLEQMRSNSMPLKSMPLSSMPLNCSMPRASSLTLIPDAHARDDCVLIMRRDGCGTGMGSGTGMSGGAGMGGNTGTESGGGMGGVVRLTSASGGGYSLGAFPRLGQASRGLQRGEAAVQFWPKPSPPPLTSIGGGAETVSIIAIQKALAKAASAEQEASPVATSPNTAPSPPILFAPPPSPQQSQRRSSHRRSSQTGISHPPFISHPPTGPSLRESHQRPFTEVGARPLTHHAALEVSRAFASRDGIGGVNARGGVHARGGASRAVLQLSSQSLELPVPVLPGVLLPLPSPGSGNAEQQLCQLTEPFRGAAFADALLLRPWPLPPMAAVGISHAPLAHGDASAPSSPLGIPLKTSAPPVPLPLKTSFSAATLSHEGVVVIRVPAHGGSMMSAAIVVNEGVATLLKGGWVVTPLLKGGWVVTPTQPLQTATASPKAHPQLSLHALQRQVVRDEKPPVWIQGDRDRYRDEKPPAHLLRSGSGKQGSPPGCSDAASQRMRRQNEHAGDGAASKSPPISPSSPPLVKTSFGVATLSKEGFVLEPVQAQGSSASRAATSSNEFGVAVAPSDTPANTPAQGTSAAVALMVSPSTPRRSVETKPNDPSEQGVTPWEHRDVHTPDISTRASAGLWLCVPGNTLYV